MKDSSLAVKTATTSKYGNCVFYTFRVQRSDVFLLFIFCNSCGRCCCSYL